LKRSRFAALELELSLEPLEPLEDDPFEDPLEEPLEDPLEEPLEEPLEDPEALEDPLDDPLEADLLLPADLEADLLEPATGGYIIELVVKEYPVEEGMGLGLEDA